MSNTHFEWNVHHFIIVLIAVTLWMCVPEPSQAQYNLIPRSRDDGATVIDDAISSPSRTLFTPYLFYSDTFGTAFGAAYAVIGWPQEQSSIVGTVIGGTNETVALYVIGTDFQVNPFDRLFLDFLLAIGHYGDLRAYTDGNPDYPNEQAGSNDSDEDDFIEGDGNDNFIRLRFRYLLPIGDGKNEIIHNYIVDRGLLVENPSGAESWNPFKSGRTYLEFEPFYRSQVFTHSEGDEEFNANGIKVSIQYNNTDFMPNPSRGSRQRLSYVRDFGWFNSTNPWDAIEFDYAKFIDLGPTEKLRQRVLALNFWTAYAMEWSESVNSDGVRVVDGPPSYEGGRLGGIQRMRAYPPARYNDRAAIYYGLEYRFIPNWNPLNAVPIFRELDPDWLQGVAFAEVGRVDDDWDLAELHTDMKWDVGFGVRAFLKGLLLRVDFAGSPESFGIQAMVGHAF